ncbi:MAG TPA: ABC transporter substrate-binding protein [Gammaproteobacteria bacterium]|nr:ABC transporter substrate-binding protein [Gammaproteobacteria bacterium]
MPSYRRRSQLAPAHAAAYLSLFLLLPRLACAELPSVASINLCTDQLVLSVADPAQIRSLSWLSADPEESMLANQASVYPLNYGSAEELMAIGADVVIAGSQTSPFTRSLLRRLGSTIVEIEPAASLDDVERNLRAVGAAIGRDREAGAATASMRARVGAMRERRDARTRSAVVVRAGGFTVGRNTLANELIGLAGLDNVVANLDRWGSLSIETLLATKPEVIIMTSYRESEASLANSFFSHPGLASIAGATRLEVPARYFACGAPESLAAAELLLEQMAPR